MDTRNSREDVVKKMDDNRKRSMSDFLAGMITGAALTLLVTAIRGSRTRDGSEWDDAWANSSSPLDLEWGGKGGKPEAERSSKPADDSALD